MAREFVPAGVVRRVVAKGRDLRRIIMTTSVLSQEHPVSDPGSRFHFNIRSGNVLLPDAEVIEFRSVYCAVTAALYSAKGILARLR